MNISWFASTLLWLVIFVAAAHAEDVDWPILDSQHPKYSLHPKIIESLLSKPSFTYRGQRFTAKDPRDGDVNQGLAESIDFIMGEFKDGKRIQIIPTVSMDKLKSFKQKSQYYILINGEHLSDRAGQKLKFRIRVVDDKPITRPLAEIIEANKDISLFDVFGDNPLCLGSGTTEFSKVQQFIEGYAHNETVRAAIEIMAASDLADHIDIKRLSKYIRRAVSFSRAAELQAVIERIEQDIALLTKASKRCQDCSATFRAQIQQMLGYGKMVEGYGNLDGALNSAIRMIIAHPRLLDGIIPESLQAAKGFNLFALRTALFYIAYLTDKARFDGLRSSKLIGFYPGLLEGDDALRNLIGQTILLQDGRFYTPACAYIKNADMSVEVKSSCGYSGNFRMTFTDCSGFILNIAKIIYPDLQYIKERHGLTTYHLAALFDLLANEQKQTSGIFYSVVGDHRLLEMNEKLAIEKIARLPAEGLEQLQIMFEPVFAAEDLRIGDVIIQRHIYGYRDRHAPLGQKGAEGHALLVVEPDPQNPLCVELTSGHSFGYGWRRVKLAPRKNYVSRILRFKREPGAHLPITGSSQMRSSL